MKRQSKTKKTDPIDEFIALPDAEKKRIVAEYDKPIALGPDGLPGRPLNASERAAHRKFDKRGKAGRPVVGQGAKMIPVTIEKGLLKDVNQFAKRHGLNRSQMIAQGLRLVMAGARAAS